MDDKQQVESGPHAALTNVIYAFQELASAKVNQLLRLFVQIFKNVPDVPICMHPYKALLIWQLNTNKLLSTKISHHFL